MSPTRWRSSPDLTAAGSTARCCAPTAGSSHLRRQHSRQPNLIAASAPRARTPPERNCVMSNANVSNAPASKKAVILVTGASSGFGRLTAEALAKAGHTIYASMRDVAGRNAGNTPEMAKTPPRDRPDLRALQLDGQP